MNILVATEKPFAAEAVDGMKDIICNAGHEVRFLEGYESHDQLVAAAADADGLIVRSDRITADVIAAARRLKVVVRAGAGYDNIDLEACSGRGIAVMNTPGQNSNAVAELVIAMMIFMSRNRFCPGTGHELKGKKLGIQAFGNVGRLVAEKAAALGMEVMAFDPFIPDQEISSAGVLPAESLEQMYRECSFVSLHIPATEQTTGSIGYDLVSLMPENGCLINTARKEVIDEEGLIRAMKERADLKYATDIAADRQKELDEEFGCRAFATPRKMGAETAEANINAGLAAARQTVDFLKDGKAQFKVNV